MNTNQHNQIEAYLSGEMNAEQLAKFESELQVNPELQQELNFQSEVITGIGEYRKAELLARMDVINVAPVWWSFVQQFSTLQYIGGAVVATLIGGTAWYAFENNKELGGISSTVSEIVVDAPTYEEYVWDLPEDENNELIPSINEDQQLDEVVEEKRSPIKKKFSPVVAVPSVSDVEGESEFVPEDAGELTDISTNEPIKNTPIDVEIVESKGANIKYRYYAGKLYLYGQFQNHPYEIIEINSASGRRIYLYHLDGYYEITANDKPVGVEPIKDSRLIQELSILRKTK